MDITNTPLPNKALTSNSSHKLIVWLIILGITIVLSGGYGYYTYFYKPPPGDPTPVCETLGDGVDLSICTAEGKTYFRYFTACSCPGAGGNERDANGNIIIDMVDCTCDRLFNSSGREVPRDSVEDLDCKKYYSCFEKTYRTY